MAKRRGGSEVDEGEVRQGPYVTEVGVAEVDRILDACKFRNSSSSTRRTLPKVDRIMDGGKFRKLSAHRSASNDKNTKVDHISRMPDAILQFIISLLTMREAAATTILSTRWRNLWTTSASCLNFDIPNMLGHDYPRDMFRNRSKHYIMKKRSNFTIWVDNVMQLCLAPRLDALRLSFVLDKDSATDIDRWIMSALTRGVIDIELDFHFEEFLGDLHDNRKEYEFPAQQVASSLKYLHLKYCKLHLPPDFASFTSLVSLSLSFVRVTHSLMENILSKCPLLEFLSLQHCSHPNSTTFKFTGPSLLLKHLRIGRTGGIANIEVHDINLLSFELGASLQKLSIKNAPHLARLVLFTHVPLEFLSDVPRLETLFLLQILEKTSIVPQSHVFNNLKRLVFIANHCTTNLLGVVYILEACHLLQKLVLDMGIIGRSERRNNMHVETMKKLKAIPGSPHNNLKEIEIYGFQAYPEKIELAKYMLNNAAVLQKMKIYIPSKMYVGNGKWEPYEGTAKQAMSLKEVDELLQNVARPSTKVKLFRSLNF